MDKKSQKALQENGLEGIGLFYGSYIGIVVDNKDPEERGRLKLSVPSVFGDPKATTEWVYGSAIAHGDGYGIWCIPSVGSNVMVSFLNGNLELPFWVNGSFSDAELSAEFKDYGTDGIVLRHNKLLIKTRNAQIELFENGKVTLDADGDIEVKSKGRIEISNPLHNLRGLFNELGIVINTLTVSPPVIPPVPIPVSATTIAQMNALLVKINTLFK